ncbi:MAG: hypothetical protein KBB75_00905 [Candidatus Pacebacteria bacterium]|jgi:hypothetical protein|nr:hypothetical protein [Candidatus Paceibacterota bacterium]
MIQGILNSNFFSGLATIITGAIAFLVYKLAKRSEKINASRIILMEIRNAEFSINRIKETGVIDDYVSILPQNSWKRYKHLFVKNFNNDEFRLIDQFYLKCSLSEKQVSIFNDFLTISSQEKTRIIQGKLLELIDLYKDDGLIEDNQNYKKHKDKILTLFHNESYWYEGNSPKLKILKYINTIEFILSSNVAQKLQKISSRLF